MIGGSASLNWRESKGPLTDTVDVIRCESLSFAELPRRLVGFFVKLPLPDFELALQQLDALCFRLNLPAFQLELLLVVHQPPQLCQCFYGLPFAFFVRVLKQRKNCVAQSVHHGFRQLIEPATSKSD